MISALLLHLPLISDRRSLQNVQGYRDAHCLFLEAPVDGSASYGDLHHPYLLSQKRQEFCLCLAIHAPRRGVVEVHCNSLH
jgi:hypothetical protein